MMHAKVILCFTNLAMCLLCCQTLVAHQATSDKESDTIIIDDFTTDKLVGWQISGSPDYYKGGFGTAGLSIVQDAERNANVLKAHVTFKDPRASEVVFITRMLTERPLKYKCASVSFWYKITTNQLDKERGLICRLRTSDTAFTDYVFGQGTDVTPNHWRHVEIDLSKPKRISNIYASLFDRNPIREVTFRIDDEDQENVEFDFYVADIRLRMKEAQVVRYEPVGRPLEPHIGVNTLIITHSAAGYYDIEPAARSLPDAREVKRLLFRGLHFPIFDFPTSFAELARYDIVAMIDVDPYVLTLEQVKMLCDFVASGGGLLFAGGPNTFGASQDFKAPLRDILPVTFQERIGLIRTDATPKVLCDHPAILGLTHLGKVSRMNALTPRPGSTMLLALDATQPRSWGWYTGGGKNDALLIQTTESHSGKAAACLELKDFYKDPKTGTPLWVGVALIQGDSNGYTGENAYPARPNTTYNFSFWAKGNVPKFRVECLAWKTDKATPNDREHIQTTLGEVKPTNEWKRYDGSFTTTAQTKKFVLSFRIHESPKTVNLGEKLFVDDVEVTEQGKTQNLLTNPGAEEDISLPVLVVWEVQKGRVAVLNAIPDMTVTTENSFFTSDSYCDMLRQILTWLAKREQEVWIKSFAPSTKTPRRGDTVDFLVTLNKTQPVGVRLSVALEHAGKIVMRKAQVLGAEEDKTVSFQYQIGKDHRADGKYRATLTASDPLGDFIATREASFEVVPPYQTRIEFLYGKAAFAPGSSMKFNVGVTTDPPAALPGSLALSVKICDQSGATIHEFPLRGAVTQFMEYEYLVPELEKGEYRLIVDLIDKPANTILSQSVADFSVVDRLDLTEFYPIISWLGTEGGGQMLDEVGLRERVDDLIAHGFNTIAIGGGKAFAATPLPNNKRLLNFAERYAQSRGMAVIYEYTRFTDISHDTPAPVCPFDPGYAKHFEETFGTDISVCQSVPRLISFKILDEPTVSEASLDFCAHCQTAYKQKYGTPLRRLKDIPPNALQERLNHNEFISSLASTGYRIGYELKTRRRVGYGLLLTYMSTIAGYANIDRGQEDAYEWSRYADYIDFDVYPYFYPDSDKVRMVRAHWVFAYLRAVARQWQKPMGFYVELDDRNYPFQINPVRASRECAYTAVAQGCDYLNSFINTAFGTGNGARPERWEDCGQAMRQIAAVAPLLKKMPRPFAQVAVYFPHTQWYVQAKPYTPTYAYQMVLRAFGECDILHEKVLREKGTGPLRAILLLGVDILPDDCADMLLAFVRRGGTLIADHIPTRNQTGAACKLAGEFFSGTNTVVIEKLTFAHRKEGLGQVILVSDELDKTFKEAVERPTPPLRDALLKTMRHLLLQSGAAPHALANNPEIETGVRLGRDCAMLVVVNHAPDSTRAKIELNNLGLVPSYVCDLVTGEPLPYKQQGTQTLLELELPERTGSFIGLYPDAPTRHELQIHTPRLRRGGQLRYTIQIIGKQATPARGHHLVEVTVTDPNGKIQPRYGGLLATTDGTLTRNLPLALNAVRGRWSIMVRDRYNRTNARAQFQVE